MNTTLDPQNVLPLIYPYVLHLVPAPIVITDNYANFIKRMWIRLAQAPFYSNLSDPSRVGCINIIMS